MGPRRWRRHRRCCWCCCGRRSCCRCCCPGCCWRPRPRRRRRRRPNAPPLPCLRSCPRVAWSWTACHIHSGRKKTHSLSVCVCVHSICCARAFLSLSLSLSLSLPFPMYYKLPPVISPPLHYSSSPYIRCALVSIPPPFSLAEVAQHTWCRRRCQERTLASENNVSSPEQPSHLLLLLYSAERPAPTTSAYLYSTKAATTTHISSPAESLPKKALRGEDRGVMVVVT